MADTESPRALSISSHDDVLRPAAFGHSLVAFRRGTEKISPVKRFRANRARCKKNSERRTFVSELRPGLGRWARYPFAVARA